MCWEILGVSDGIKFKINIEEDLDKFGVDDGLLILFIGSWI